MPYLILLLAALLTAPAAADPGFDQARAIFLKAADGDGGAVDDAIKRFEALAAADPGRSPLFQAYLGAAQAMQGREAWLPWNKMRATERGLATLEKALRRLEPRHDTETCNGTAVALETRLVAVTTYFSLPALFNRFDAGKQLLRDAFAHPGYTAAPAEVRARLHRQAALAAARDGKPDEERQHLNQAATLAPHIQELGS